jgi:hypothetical protein
VWERHQIIINAWGRFGRKFAPAALDLLKTEPSQYMQWELLNGNLQTRQDYVYRDYWDIWIPVNILVPMEFPEGGRRPPQPKMDESDLNAMLHWLESGARPKDPWVYNHMLYHLADFVSGNDTHRLLLFFNAHPERAKNYWIIEHLSDPAAIPLLEYWSTLPAPPDQLEDLKSLIARLDNRNHRNSPATTPCCEATEICLLDHLTHAEPPSPFEIHSEKDAQAWLRQAPQPPTSKSPTPTIPSAPLQSPSNPASTNTGNSSTTAGAAPTPPPSPPADFRSSSPLALP